jgi:predicted metalloprotease
MALNPNARLDPSQVEDRRGMGRAGPIVIGGGGLGIVGLIIALLLGFDPFGGAAPPTTQTQPGTAVQPAQPAPSVEECRTGADAQRRADCRIVGYTNSIQAFWTEAFAGSGAQYQPARTVLYSGATEAACGFASAAQGPFYCPEDQQVYLDLSFFSELQQRFGAQGGPFAEAYVLAHEYGHHVQNQLGILSGGISGQTGPGSAAVQIELQADCLAGVWAHHAAATGYLQPLADADVAAALDAAAAVGDDRIQRRTQGRVIPESWTHGSSRQRQQSFAAGYSSGSAGACTSG